MKKIIIPPLLFILTIGLSALSYALPKNAHQSHDGWACNAGFKKQGQQCNPIYIPLNASLKGNGWVCNAGFKRRSNQCNPLRVVKIKPRKKQQSRPAQPSKRKGGASLQQAKQLYLNGNHEQAFSALYPLANSGDASAQFYLAELYYSADSDLNRKEAIKWYKKAAAAGNAYAQYNLGNVYYDGRLVPTNLDVAADWYEKAAKSGIPEAQLNLGYMFSAGKGVAKNDQLATLWYKAAANFGNPKAQSNLGYRYCAGIGADKNYEQCAFWVKKAMRQGHKNAHKIWKAFKLYKYAGVQTKLRKKHA